MSVIWKLSVEEFTSRAYSYCAFPERAKSFAD